MNIQGAMLGGGNLPPYYSEAVKAGNILGWDPDVVYAQWVHETGWFKSPNFKNNNNIAGQTWTPSMGASKRGTARPSNEGGYYVKYDNAVQGYVDFVQKNSRYNNVKNYKTELEQIQEIKRSGWAVDPNYVSKVSSVLNTVREQNNGLNSPISGGGSGMYFGGISYDTADPSQWVTGKKEGVDAEFLKRLAGLGKKYGKKVNIISGLRSFSEQQHLYNLYKSGKGNLAATPGNSRHNYGLAVDVDGWARNISESEYKKFGMHKPVKSPQNEPWHIEPIETKGKSASQLKDVVVGAISPVSGVDGFMNIFRNQNGLPFDAGFDEVGAGAYSLFKQLDDLAEIKTLNETSLTQLPQYTIQNITGFSVRFIIVVIGLVFIIKALGMQTMETLDQTIEKGKKLL